MGETTALYMPEFKFQWNISKQHRRRTKIIEAKSGREQRLREYGQRVRRFSASSDLFDQADTETFLNFYDLAEGAWGAFYFFEPNPTQHTNFAYGTLASETSVTLPFKAANVSNIRVNGVPTSPLSVLDTGPGGETVITFSAAKTGPLVLDIVGRLRLICRFESDDLDEKFVQDAADPYSVFEISVKELVP